MRRVLKTNTPSILPYMDINAWNVVHHHHTYLDDDTRSHLVNILVVTNAPVEQMRRMIYRLLVVENK